MNTAEALIRARELLATRQARATAARQQVLAALLASGRPLAHAELQSLIEPALDRVTLYRVLEWLEQAGIVHRIQAPDRSARFSISHGPDCHAHFQCERCGQLYCLSVPVNLTAEQLPAGFVARRVEMTVSGCCAACRRDTAD